MTPRGRRLLLACAAVLGVLVAGCTDASAPVPRPVATGAPDTTGTPRATATPETTAACTGDADARTLRTTVGDDTYSAQVHVPEGDPDRPLPAVLDFHGLGGNGFAQGGMSGFPRLGDREGFLTVTPNGQRSSGSGLPGWELTAGGSLLDEPDRDDVAYVERLIDTLVADWCVDPTRVYVTGFSNGGYFVSELLCDLADRIAGGVSVAALARPDDCAPSRPVPYLAVHGTADPVVPFDGSGRSSLLRDGLPGRLADGLEVLFSRSIPDEFAAFAAAAGCDPDPARSDVAPDVVRRDWTGCAAAHAFLEVEGGGHRWPRADEAGVDATEVAWDFLSEQRLPPT